MNLWRDTRCPLCGRSHRVKLDPGDLLPGVPLPPPTLCRKCLTRTRDVTYLEEDQPHERLPDKEDN